MSVLRIRLFGQLELTRDGVPLSTPAAYKARSLLAYLIMRHDQAVPRDRLAGLFWPERPDARARRALSHALWQIRQALDPADERLVTEGDMVSFRLADEDWLDVAAFEDALSEQAEPKLAPRPEGEARSEDDARSLTAALDVYRADFLEACYDDWTLVERERLRELYLRALERWIVICKREGDDERALAAAQRWVAADPLREAAHRELMRLYHLLGRSRAAMEQFAALRATLAEELDVSPAPASIALYQEIVETLETGGNALSHLPVPLPPPPLLQDLAHLPLVGRTTERATLLHALQDALQGHGQVALVEGDAGVGKTRLIRELTADARWRGFQVGQGKADPLAEAAPYQLLRDALAPLLTPLRLTQLATLVPPPALGAIAALFPDRVEPRPELADLAPRLTPQGQEWLWDGLGVCLVGLAAVAPLLLVLEDVHWADEASLAALPHLAGHLSTADGCLVLSSRPFETQERAVVWETLQALDQTTSLLRLHLPPLERAEAITLVQRALGVSRADIQAAAFAGRLYEKTAGNLLFMVETLKLLLEAGALELSPDNTWLFPSTDLTLPTPASVRALIGERLARLVPELQATLEQSAVLGENTEFPVLLQADRSAPSAEALARRLSKLHRRGFLAETETGYRFEHDLTRQVIYQAIDQSRRGYLHHQAAAALETHHPERVESLARHFYRSGVRDKALAYTLQAGERAAAVYDYARALAHYRRAVTLTDAAGERWDVLARQEEVLGALSRRAEQGQVLDEMSRLAETLDDPLRRADTLYRQGWLEVLAGQPTQALSRLQKAAALARATDERNLLGHCLIAIARAWWRIGDTAPCQAAVEEAYTIFQATGHSPGQSQALNMLGNLHLGLTGDYAQALRYFEALRELAVEQGSRYREAAAQGNIGITCSLLGAYGRSRAALEEALQVMHQIGDRHWQGIILHWQAANQRGLGDLAQAQATAEQALAACRAVGNRNFEIATLELLGMIALDQHAPQEARRHFQAAVDVAQTNGQTMDWALNQSHLALACLHLGQPKEARQLAEQAIAKLEGLEGQVGRIREAYFERCQIIAATDGPKAARPDLERAYRHLEQVAAQIEDPALRRSFLEKERRNRAIVAAYRLGRIPPPLRQQRVALPRVNAPTGRRLRQDEYVTVKWTVNAPEDAAISGTVARRRHRLLRLLREAAAQAAAPTVVILATTLDVSTRTLKRDLAALRAGGHAAYTRGARAR